MGESPKTVLAHYETHEPTDVLDALAEPQHFRLGRAAHLALLEPHVFAKTFLKEPAFTGLTKDGRVSDKSAEARESRLAWYKSLPPEALVLSEKLYLKLEGMVNSILNCPDACALLKQGIPELTGYYRHPSTGVLCKIRPDLWNEQVRVLIDIKTTENSSREAFSKSLYKYKYPLSMAMYADGIFQISGIQPETHVFVVVETKPPYLCAVYYLKESAFQLGYEEYQHSMIKLGHCITTGQWPQRQAYGMEEIDCPPYAYKKEVIYEF